jgi:hypothetical protein
MSTHRSSELPHPIGRTALILLAAVCGCAGLCAGCQKSDEITHYTTPKVRPFTPALPESPAPLGGMRQDTESTALRYDTPEGWGPGTVNQMRKAAFEVTDGAQHVEITVIDLSEGAGTLLSNVNRWRKQVELDEITQEQLQQQKTVVQAGTLSGTYVTMDGPSTAERPESILGVVIVHAGRNWFFKLKGDSELAARERERFETFVRSVRFEQAAGDSDGK